MIDYNLLAKSIDYYELKGYNRIESPWTVTQAVSDITKPEGAKDFKIEGDGKVLVASAEQSFIYMMIKGFLPLGKHMSITPCFRKESFDLLHSKYFMKNELIQTKNVCIEEMDKMIEDAKSFYDYVFKGGCEVFESSTGIYDIQYKGVELGSYGIRKHGHLSWIFGTGCSEPRTSNTLKQYGISYN